MFCNLFFNNSTLALLAVKVLFILSIIELRRYKSLVEGGILFFDNNKIKIPMIKNAFAMINAAIPKSIQFLYGLILGKVLNKLRYTLEELKDYTIALFMK